MAIKMERQREGIRVVLLLVKVCTVPNALLVRYIVTRYFVTWLDIYDEGWFALMQLNLETTALVSIKMATWASSILFLISQTTCYNRLLWCTGSTGNHSIEFTHWHFSSGLTVLSVLLEGSLVCRKVRKLDISIFRSWNSTIFVMVLRSSEKSLEIWQMRSSDMFKILFIAYAFKIICLDWDSVNFITSS